MDYHLDWLYAALCLASGAGALASPLERDPLLKTITGTQEDIDLVVSFEDVTGASHIILVEAKGDSAFANGVLESKAARLRAIFGDDGQRWRMVRAAFLLMSPTRPTARLRISKWPSWMLTAEGTLRWRELKLPGGRQKVVRCDEVGVPSRLGSFWKVTRAAEAEAVE
jgi:hypothetical protein